MDIAKDTPEDRRNRDRHARIVGTTCPQCGGAVLRTNLISLKDGRKVCSICLEAVISNATPKIDHQPTVEHLVQGHGTRRAFAAKLSPQALETFHSLAHKKEDAR